MEIVLISQLHVRYELARKFSCANVTVVLRRCTFL